MKRQRSLVIAGLALLLYLAWNVRRFDTDWETYSQRSAVGAVPPWSASSREAIVVLTGARGRIPKAIALLKVRGSGILLITGAGKGISKKELLNQQGDAAGSATEIWRRVEVESQATSTLENAQESAKLLSAKRIEKVILVTSDYHMPRALAIFQKVYPSVTYWPYPSSASASDVGPIRMVEDYAKPTVEFFKWFLFRHFFIHLL